MCRGGDSSRKRWRIARRGSDSVVGGRCLGARRTSSGGAQPVRRESGRDHVVRDPRAGRAGRPGRRRRRGRGGGPAGARARRRAGPDQRGHRRAGRGARRDDHRGERQAPHLGARRGGPGGVGVPLGGRGDPYLVRRGAAPRRRPAAEGRIAYVRRVPKGPVLAISPFNFPLNLVAHKVAPALAVGAPSLLKPAPKTPLSALLLAEIVGLVRSRPAGGDAQRGQLSRTTAPPALVADPRLPVVSFTGSGSGRPRDPGRRRRASTSCSSSAATPRSWSAPTTPGSATSTGRPPGIAAFCTYQAGQSCISVQRVFADTTVYDDLRDRVVKAVKAPWHRRPGRSGHPRRPDDRRARRAPGRAVGAARPSRGRTLLTGGDAGRGDVRPDRARGRPADAKVTCEEVFGPVLVAAAGVRPPTRRSAW